MWQRLPHFATLFIKHASMASFMDRIVCRWLPHVLFSSTVALFESFEEYKNNTASLIFANRDFITPEFSFLQNCGMPTGIPSPSENFQDQEV